MIPLGFGIGLTFPVFLLAAQNQVKTADVGEAGGLIQFLQSLGGAVGLSVLASFQATRFASLDPSPSAACSSASPPMPLCAGYLGSLESSLISSYDQTFLVMLGLLGIAFVFALFLRGRLTKTSSQKEAVPEHAPQVVATTEGSPVSAEGTDHQQPNTNFNPH